MPNIKKNSSITFHQTDIGAGSSAGSISYRARKDPKRRYLATDFKFVNEKEYLAKNAKYGAKPFPKNLHFISGGALTALRRMKQEGHKTKQFVIAMGVGHLLNPKYLGLIAKYGKEVLTPKGSFYFVSTWNPEYFRETVVPHFEKEGYTFKLLKRDIERQMDHSGKAAAWHEEYGAVQWEYQFTLK